MSTNFEFEEYVTIRQKAISLRKKEKYLWKALQARLAKVEDLQCKTPFESLSNRYFFCWQINFLQSSSQINGTQLHYSVETCWHDFPVSYIRLLSLDCVIYCLQTSKPPSKFIYTVFEWMWLQRVKCIKFFTMLYCFV